MYELDKKFTSKPRDDKGNKSVQSYLHLIAKNHNRKKDQDDINRRIQKQYNRGFNTTTSPKRMVGPKRISQAIWRTINRMKPLDFMIHGQQQDENGVYTPAAYHVERLVTAGVGTVMDRGDWDECLRGKHGIFWNATMYGDGFGFIAENQAPGFPLKFTCVDNTNVYADLHATHIRYARKAVVVFPMSASQAMTDFPGIEKKAQLGRLPRDTEYDKDIRYEYEDEREREEDLIEIAYCIDLDNLDFTVIAGPSCAILEQKRGKNKFPYMKGRRLSGTEDDPVVEEEGVPYMPVFQIFCSPGSEGLYNNGLGNMFYDLVELSDKLMNAEIRHMIHNINPPLIVNIGQQKAGEFAKKMRAAERAIAQGKRGIIIQERGASDPNSGAIQPQTLTFQNGLQEYQLMEQIIDQQFRRCGINLDEIDRGGNMTATQIMAEEENSNSFVKQMMEYNASEFQRVVEVTMDAIQQFIPSSDETPLDLATTIRVETEQGKEEIRTGGFTMGQVARILKEGHFFVRVNARTGVFPSEVLRYAQVRAVMPMVQPGTVAFNKLFQQIADINQQDLGPEDFMPPAPPQPEGGIPAEMQQMLGAAMGELGDQAPSGTDRLTINPRQEQRAAL